MVASVEALPHSSRQPTPSRQCVEGTGTAIGQLLAEHILALGTATA